MNPTSTSPSAALERWWRGDVPGSESLLCVLLSIGYAFSFAMLLIWLNLPLDEAGEWQTFVEVWLLVPVMSLGACAWVVARPVEDRGAYLGNLALGQGVFVAISAAMLRAATSAEPAVSPDILRAAACLVPSLIAGLGLAIPASRLSSRGRPMPGPILAFLFLGVSLLGLSRFPAPWQMGLVLVVACLLLILRESVWPMFLRRFGFRPNRVQILLLDIGVVAAAALLIFDPHLHFNTTHAVWYLGPAHEILKGAPMLVDVYGVYGVLSIYFIVGLLAIWPFPLSYFTVSWIMLTLVIAQYAAFFALLRYLGLRTPHAALALGLVFLANFIGLEGALSAFPSLGPMRFGLPYFLLILVVLRGRRPDWTRVLRIGEGAVVAVASLWSLEALVFSLPAYLAIVVLEAGFAAREAVPGSRKWLSTASLRIVGTMLAIALTHLSFAVYVYGTSGSWPDWQNYFAMVQVYTPSGFGLLLEPIPALGPWVAFMFFYAGSALACVIIAPRTEGLAKQTALALVLATTVMGVAQFAVYVGMSMHYRLHSVAMPAVFVAAYWADRLIRSETAGQASRRVATFAAYAVAALMPFYFIAQLYVWNQHDAPDSLGPRGLAASVNGCDSFPECFTSPKADSPLTVSAEILIDRHVGPDDRLAVILEDSSTSEVLIRAGRRNAIPLNAPSQDAMGIINGTRVVDWTEGLAIGDILLMETRLGRFLYRGESFKPDAKGESIVWAALSQIGEKFGFESLSSDGDVVAVRLVPKVPIEQRRVRLK